MPIRSVNPNHNGWYIDQSTKDKMDAEDPDICICEKCGNSWLELIQVFQFPKFAHLIIGQKPAHKSEVGFWMYRCPKCGELYEPSIQLGARDKLRRVYDRFVEYMGKIFNKGADV